MLVDAKQTLDIIYVEGEGRILPNKFEDLAEVLEFLNEENHNYNDIFEIYVTTREENLTSNITEDLAEAWIKDREETYFEVIQEDMCPIFVQRSNAWQDYQEEQS